MIRLRFLVNLVLWTAVDSGCVLVFPGLAPVEIMTSLVMQTHGLLVFGRLAFCCDSQEAIPFDLVDLVS